MTDVTPQEFPDGEGKSPKSATLTKPAPRFEMIATIRSQIDQIAKQLPGMCEEYNITNPVSGYDLIQRGIQSIKRAGSGLVIPVEIGQTYDLPGVALRDVNHVHKLRLYYRIDGILGIHNYLKQIEPYRQTMMMQYPSLWSEGGNYMGVEEGTQMPIDSTFMEAAQKMAAAENKVLSN
jgi:hypothetical protein